VEFLKGHIEDVPLPGASVTTGAADSEGAGPSCAITDTIETEPERSVARAAR